MRRRGRKHRLGADAGEVVERGIGAELIVQAGGGIAGEDEADASFEGTKESLPARGVFRDGDVGVDHGCAFRDFEQAPRMISAVRGS